MLTKVVKMTTLIEAPYEATHYTGFLLDEPVWWKQVGLNWYNWEEEAGCWYYYAPHSPAWAKPILEENNDETDKST
jgi:hypothetical protein